MNAKWTKTSGYCSSIVAIVVLNVSEMKTMDAVDDAKNVHGDCFENDDASDENSKLFHWRRMIRTDRMRTDPRFRSTRDDELENHVDWKLKRNGADEYLHSSHRRVSYTQTEQNHQTD